jgi:hypothetical protein
MSPDPFGSGQPPGFLTGYLIGCAFLCALFVMQLFVLALLQ